MDEPTSEPTPVRPKLYSDLAAWWPLLSAPEEYDTEAVEFARLLEATGAQPLETLLELGSGGGNTASHLKQRFRMTLVDLSPQMLEVSRALNPECEHLQGDMRTVRLGRTFDAVFIHDAIMYMTTEADLAAAIASAAAHCRPGGALLLAPDHTREGFEPSTDHGGHDGHDRALRYLEWTYDPDPEDDACTTDFAYLLRWPDGSVTVEHDRHRWGMFPRAVWLRLLDEAGFSVQIVIDPWEREVFVGVKRQ